MVLPPKARQECFSSAPVPKLTDLFNPIASNKDLLFNQNDPYEISALFDLVIQHNGSATRLEINELVDLQNANLLSQFDGKKTEAPKSLSEEGG